MATNSSIVKSIIRDIKKAAGKGKKPKHYSTSDQPFEMLYYGLKLPQIRAISKNYYPQIKELTKKQTFAVADELMKLEIYEYKVIAFDWTYRKKKEFIASDFSFFQRWVKNDLCDWNDVDDLCTHSVGHLIYLYPELLPKVLKWSKSKKWPVRRAAAVSLIPAIKKKRYIREMFVTCNHLLLDEHDLVRKGYGWLLKEGSRHFPNSVLNYVTVHKGEMPRVSLRYAIEKLPAKMKKQAMSKDQSPSIKPLK